jgi:hypothetical protein
MPAPRESGARPTALRQPLLDRGGLNEFFERLGDFVSETGEQLP